MGAITLDFSQVEPGTLVTVGDELIAAEPGNVMFTLSREDADGTEHLVSQLYSPEEVGELAGSLLMLSRMARRQRRRWRRKGLP
jgi:hypothetical protein